MVLVGRKLENWKPPAAKLSKTAAAPAFRSAIFRDEEAVKAMVKTVVAERGQIHHLVNNAGNSSRATDRHQPERLRDRGAHQPGRRFLIAKEVFLQSMSKHGGSIVNMLADMWGGMPGMATGAARAGMENFTKTAAYMNGATPACG